MSSIADFFTMSVVMCFFLFASSVQCFSLFVKFNLHNLYFIFNLVLNHFYNKLKVYISLNSSQALTTLHVFWDSPCMFLIQLTDLEECCVLRTVTLHLIPYLPSSQQFVLYMDNTSYTTTNDYQKYHILKSTQIMLKPICVKQKYMVSNDFAFYLHLYVMYREFLLTDIIRLC